MLDYFPNADHAPIYAAEAAGYFKEAGIDVAIRQPPDPAAPLKQLAARACGPCHLLNAEELTGN